jgi:hypothetical protein
LDKVFDESTIAGSEDEEDDQEEDDQEDIDTVNENNAAEESQSDPLSTSVFMAGGSTLTSPITPAPKSPSSIRKQTPRSVTGSFPSSTQKSISFSPVSSGSSSSASPSSNKSSSKSVRRSSLGLENPSSGLDISFDNNNNSNNDNEDIQEHKSPDSSQQAESASSSKTTSKKIRKEKKRETLIRAGEELLQNMDQDVSAPRSSKRMKFAPLQHWALEELNYKRDTTTIIGTMMPTLNVEKPITKLVEAPPTPPKRKISSSASSSSSKKSKSSASTPASSKKNGKSKKKSKLKKVDEEEYDLNDNEGYERKLQSSCWVQDAATNAVVFKPVAKSQQQIVMAPLNIPTDGTTIPPERIPIGGKSFDEPGFLCGILDLPPLSSKPTEYTDHWEVFYVRAAESEKLKAVIHKTEFKLSTGDTFVIPRRNMYSLHNLSTTKTVRLFFNLISTPEAMESATTE